MDPEEVKGKRIAIPGTLTTAYLACKLFQPDFEHVIVPFDKILDAVKEHEVDAGKCHLVQWLVVDSDFKFIAET